MKNKKFKTFFIIIPLIIGIIGYSKVEGNNFLQALYLSLNLYGLGADNPPQNIYIEIARWLAPVATASIVVLIASSLRRAFHNTVAHIKGNSVAVYGNDKDIILKQLGVDGMDGGDKFIDAKTYILTGSDDENLSFYNLNREKLSDKEVYAKCSSMSSQWVADSNLHMFCPEEIAASRFWKEHCIYPISKAKGHVLSIAIIGFDKLGRELLLSALQNNFFDQYQTIVYHIWGDSKGFNEIHHEAHLISNEIIFHRSEWYEEIDFINSFVDIIIETRQENQNRLVKDFLLAMPTDKKLYVFTAHSGDTRLFENNDRIIDVDWTKFGYRIENIVKTELFEKAKWLNLRYRHLYSDDHPEETEQNKETEWKKLSTFHRYSCISAADYNDICAAILEYEGVKVGSEDFKNIWFEKFALLEHNRWCCYYYLNNWTYNEVRDDSKRQHCDLIPYQLLPENEKNKDRENIQHLFSLRK